MRFLNAILIKLCLGFVFGIYLGFADVVSLQLLFYSFFGFLFLLFVFKWVWPIKTAFLIVSVLMFVVLGGITTALRLPKNQPQHIIHLDLSSSNAFPVQAEISEVLRPSTFNHKFILTDLEIEGKPYRGKLLWQVSKDKDISDLDVGQKILMFATLKTFQKPKNPQYFDYGRFMNNRNVYAVIDDDDFEILPMMNFSINAISAKQRQNIVSALRKAGFKEEHLELMQALILGQKQTIDKQTYNEFAEAGVVHILAVSGLHVGIILLIIQFLLRPLLRLPQYGRPIMVIFSILLLWCFAALAGFSPSVMRASTMFSFLALGQLNRRKTNSINMLCLSALVLLLIKPQFLFEVGFQLSYAAVFAIVMLYPVFSKMYQPRLKIPKLFVDTAYVSIAAQIGVLPFQLYYFHQFPGLFLIGNLVIIPFLGIILSGGLLCIALGLLEVLIEPIVITYSWVLDALRSYVSWLSQFENFVIQDLFFNEPMFLSLITLVFSFVIMVREFHKTRILLFLITALIFSMISIFQISKHQKVSELIVFHKSRQTLVGVKQGEKLAIYTDKLAFNRKVFLIQNYAILNRIKEVSFDTLQNFYQMKNSKLIVVDSSGVYMEEPKGEIVLLTNSPDIHLEKLLKILKPKQLIIDGNNYKSYVEHWMETLKKFNIKHHSTFYEGAISFKIP